eukprot:SAG31_NODE_3907_length_3763_cov_18.329421_1_plen_72_part_00
MVVAGEVDGARTISVRLVDDPSGTVHLVKLVTNAVTTTFHIYEIRDPFGQAVAIYTVKTTLVINRYYRKCY